MEKEDVCKLASKPIDAQLVVHMGNRQNNDGNNDFFPNIGSSFRNLKTLKNGIKNSLKIHVCPCMTRNVMS